MKLHPHAAGLLPVLDPDWRRKLFVGGLVLCIPFVGWPAVLGYRSRYVRHLFAPLAAPLPRWDEGFAGFAADGLKSMAVIFGYLAPLYAAIAFTVASRGFVPDASTALLAVAFAAFPIFATLSLPVACLLLVHGGWLGGAECAACLAAYGVLVFLVPAGFLEVSKTGRHASAFAVWRTVPFVLRNFGAYAEAWVGSSLMSLAGHCALPLAPWGVVWCYLGILALFNEVLVRAGEAPGEGWLARAIADPRLTGRRPPGLSVLADGRGEPVTVLSLVAFSAPLPRLR